MATSALGFDNYYEDSLNGDISSSATTITVNNPPSASEGYLVIEFDNSSNREIIYYTSKSGNDLVLPSAVAGRGQGGTNAVSHSSGASIRSAVVAEHFEALKDGTGLSTSFVLPSGVVKPEDLVTGAGTTWGWQSWTPSYSGVTPGTSAVVVSKYIQIGKTVHFKYKLAMANSDADLAAGFTISLPVAATADYNHTLLAIGAASFFDTSATAIYGGWTMINNSSTVFTVRFNDGTATLSNDLGIGEESGDVLFASGTYEAA